MTPAPYLSHGKEIGVDFPSNSNSKEVKRFLPNIHCVQLLTWDDFQFFPLFAVVLTVQFAGKSISGSHLNTTNSGLGM